MKLKNKKMNRICTWLLTVAMLSGMLPASVSADAPAAQTNGLDNYVVELSSDPSTSTRPSSFGTESDDGRVWADKSVSVNGSQFDVTLSALAQEYVRTSTTVVREQAAADVAMVLDMSGSMTADRIKNMKDAVNKGIDIIMAANKKNRIGIYYYSSAANAGTLFPLASYSTSQTGEGDTTDRYMTSGSNSITRKAGVTQKYIDGTMGTGPGGTTTLQTVTTTNATATQAGLNTGIHDLITHIPDLATSGEDTERVPYVLLLTDGEANTANSNWYNNPLNGSTKSGSGASGTAEISALTILTAAKLKEELKVAYSPYSGGKDVIWFNVAFGLEKGNNLATALLKPNELPSPPAQQDNNKLPGPGNKDDYLANVSYWLNSLTNSATSEYKKYGIGGTPGYLYAQDYIYFVSTEDLSKVDEALEDLGELVEAATQEKIIPFEQVNEFGDPLNLLVTDVLGTGMKLKTAPMMGAVTGTAQPEVGTVTTYTFPGLSSTVEYDRATGEIQWIIVPEEVPLIMFSDRKTPVPGNYSNPAQAPVQLTYTVGLKDAYESGTVYSNAYTGDATATARFIPMTDNPYYYDVINTEGGEFVESTKKEIGNGPNDIKASKAKSQNVTGTAAYSSANEWVEEMVDDHVNHVFVTKLGNNGKIAPLLKIEMAPVSGSATAGGTVIYRITVTNLTDDPIANVIVDDELPDDLTFVNGSIKEDGNSKPVATFAYTINSVPANGSVVLTFEAAVPSNATEGTEYIGGNAKITSVGGTSLNNPATGDSDKVNVADTFTASVTVKLDGASYAGQTVELWKGGASQYTLSGSGGTYTVDSVTPGTYDIYVKGANTGVQLSASDTDKEINYYSVSFYDGEQKYDTPAAQTVLSGGKAASPAAPTKTGYTFDKWVTTDGGTTAFDFDAAITSATDLYATWTANTNTAYKVHHYLQAIDGSYSATPSQVENLTGTTGSLTTVAAQTHTGFTAETITQKAIAADGSTVIEVRYARNLHDITFVIDSNKGTATGDTTPQVRYGATPTEPNIANKPGYTFTGWDKEIVSVTGDETYTAEFNLVGFTLTYNLNGGTVDPSNPTTYTVEEDDFTLTNPTKTGYTFAGWTGTELSEATIEVEIVKGSTGNRSYNTAWTPKQTTVTLAVYGDITDSVTATYDESMPAASAPTRAGYVFIGYFDQADGGTKYYNDDMSSAKDWDKTDATATLYAVWTELGHVTIQYAANNSDYGTVSSSYESMNPETGTAAGSTAAANLGYNFVEWRNTGGDTVGTDTTFIPQKVSGSYATATYTAIFAANTSTVTFDVYGGSSDSVIATYDQPMPAATAPTRSGYIFTGYYDQSAGGGTKYYNADMSSANDWDKTDATVTLYAGWTEIDPVTIEYVANHTAYGTVSPTEETLNPAIGTATGSEATANSGYRFVEWQNVGGNTVGADTTFVPQKDAGSYAAAVYTAVFAAIDYNITYNLDAWTVDPSNPAAFTVEDADFTLTNPTKSGFTFAGWTGTGLSEPTLTVTIAKGSIGDRVYTATWTDIPSTGNHDVVGTVVDDDTPPAALPGATVQIVRGNVQFGETAITDAEGNFTIHDIPAGIYNLKITYGQKTAIIAVTVGGDAKVVQLGYVIFPYNASSALELRGAETPPIVIDNLHPEALDILSNEKGNTGFVKVEMKIEKIDETTGDLDLKEAVTSIQTKSRSGNLTIGLYLDMIIEKYYRVNEAVNWNSEGLIGQTKGLIQVIIPIPAEVQGKSGYVVYRYHGNAVNEINTTPNADGEYLVLDQSDWTLTLYVKNFSVYAIAYKNPPVIFGGVTNYAVTFDTDGGTPSSITQSVIVGSLLTKPEDPIRAGYNFTGWYKADGSEWNFSIDKVVSDLTLTAKWTIAKNLPALDKVNHFAYMAGYPDKTFGPQRNMTRAEVTVMFARLLVEKMDVDKKYPSKFKDVDPASWYANALGYMEQFGIIAGYVDGTFRPDAPITRAEFAALASRFDTLVMGEPAIFTDVAEDYWARDYISFAAAKGWVTGYQDGTFKPGNYITRAEVVSLVNRMLERYFERSYVDSNKDSLNQFVDLTSSYWAYYDIMEATNSHDYDKTSDGETWIRHKK